MKTGCRHVGMKWMLCITLGLVSCQVYGQARYDANWVLGKNLGLSFNDTTVSLFYPICNNYELSASISDRNGNLLFYLSDTSSDSDYPGNIVLRNKFNNVISNGTGISTYSSCSDGAIILPMDTVDNKFLILYQGARTPPISCPTYNCNSLSYAIIENNPVSGLNVLEKNIFATDSLTDERLVAVKHANGTDWWVITHAPGGVPTGSCTNNFFVFLVTNGNILLHKTIPAGSIYCGVPRMLGSISSDHLGTTIASYIPDSLTSIEVFSFDRCNGDIVLKGNIPTRDSYDCELSSNGQYVYVNEGVASIRMARFNLDSIQTISKGKEYIDTLFHLNAGDRLVRTPLGTIIRTSFNRTYTGWLANIDSPLIKVEYIDSSIILDSGQYMRASLPNFPNYNLGATTIYQADAGIDTFYCEGDTTIKAVTIGSTDSIAGVTYHWLIDVDSVQQHNSQVWVKPTQST